MLDTVDICLLYAPIVRVLAYYDLFAYPLTASEIHIFLPEGDVGADELNESLAGLVDQGRLGCSDGYYYLPHRDSAIVRRRLVMEKRGGEMWRIARMVASLIRVTPFVRGIFISGQLCRYIADERSDIDYFIVTAPRRLWIVRTFFVFVRRLFLFNSRKYFCANYFVTTENLLIRERNQYAACEVASLKPMYNRDLYHAFITGNSWVRDFYPNFSPELMDLRPGVTGGERLRGLLERCVPARLADSLDEWLMERTRRFWRRKFPGRDQKVYDVSFRTRRDESRAHPQDQSPVVLDRYRMNLRNYGILDD